MNSYLCERENLTESLKGRFNELEPFCRADALLTGKGSCTVRSSISYAMLTPLSSAGHHGLTVPSPALSRCVPHPAERLPTRFLLLLGNTKPASHSPCWFPLSEYNPEGPTWWAVSSPSLCHWQWVYMTNQLLSITWHRVKVSCVQPSSIT